MNSIKIAIIREGKNPPDMRTPLTPLQCVEIKEKFNRIHLIVQSSPIRIFNDESYTQLGIPVKRNIAEADIMMGVKEVPIDMLIPNKTYFFFSHTTKEQPYNRDLLRAILNKNIRLIDYEALTNQNGSRLIGFGYYAGVVGAYNGLMAWGKRHQSFDLRPAIQLNTLADMKLELQNVKLPNIKIALTGSGRVAKGVIDVLNMINLKRVSPNEYLTKSFSQPVYTQLSALYYNKRIDGKLLSKTDFYKHPTQYQSDFFKYARVTDLYIAGHYYAEGAPFVFTRQDAKHPEFKIKVVADISCDIDGPVACTIRPSTIAKPFYGYHPQTETETHFNAHDAITVMAVDNLPCELPAVASQGFGDELIMNILPHLLNGDAKKVLERATVAKNGKLTQHFAYLQNYIDGK